ncbi:MAG: DUF3159 domain-containing protein [Frankiales bacterium]|nr:MAG: DUF3159 domain-containing protein [Frankiales bacterium]
MSEPRAVDTESLLAQMGGLRGLLDSALPATVFVLANLVGDGDLTVPIVLSLITGLLVVLLRRARGESVQQAFSGFFGLAIAVLFARATGTGEGFFLPGIITTGLTGVAFLVSLLLGKPAVAYALTAYDPRYAAWKVHEPLRRACRLATAFWTLTFFVRAGVATFVYTREGDNDGLLLIVVNAVKWPLIVAAVVLTVVLVRRAGLPAAEEQPEPDEEPASA